MVQPRKVDLNQLAKELSCTTPILADNAVTAIKLAPNAVTATAIGSTTIDASKFTSSVFGNGLVYNSFTNSIDINVDDLTLEVNTDILRVKTGGIHPSHINIDADLAFNNFQGLALRFENRTSDPVPGNPGRIIWRTDLLEARIDTGTSYVPVGGSTGHTIEDEGTPLPQRSVLNFVGVGVTTIDTGTETQITIPGTTYQKDLVTVSNVILDKTITLSHIPVTDSEKVIWNGLGLRKGLTNDYTISSNVVTLNAGITLTIGDELEVSYAY